MLDPKMFKALNEQIDEEMFSAKGFDIKYVKFTVN